MSKSLEIHDHFDGSAHCVECGNAECKLDTQSFAVTHYVRCTLESLALAGWKNLPMCTDSALASLCGKERALLLWERARTSMAEVFARRASK